MWNNIKNFNFFKLSLLLIIVGIFIAGITVAFSSKANAAFNTTDAYKSVPPNATNDFDVTHIHATNISGPPDFSPKFCVEAVEYDGGTYFADIDRDNPENNKFFCFAYNSTPTLADCFKYEQKVNNEVTKYNFHHFVASYKTVGGEHWVNNALSNNNLGDFSSRTISTSDYSSTTNIDWNKVYACFSDKIDVSVDEEKGELDKNAAWLYMYEFTPLSKNTQPKDVSQWGISYKIEASGLEEDGTYNLILTNSYGTDQPDTTASFKLTPKSEEETFNGWEYTSRDNPNLTGTIAPGTSKDFTEEGPLDIVANFNKPDPGPDPGPDPDPEPTPSDNPDGQNSVGGGSIPGLFGSSLSQTLDAISVILIITLFVVFYIAMHLYKEGYFKSWKRKR